MKIRHSLRRRIIVTFALFAALLALLYSVMLYSALRLFEDRILARQLREEVHVFLDRRDSGQKVTPPSSVHTRTYNAISAIPGDIRKAVAAMPAGEHEIEVGAAQFHLIIYQDPDTAERLFFVSDVTNLELSAAGQTYIAAALAAAFAAVTVVGTLIGIALSRTIVAPMFRLADAVQAMHPDRPSPAFASEFQDDEVGLVARRLEDAMERNEAFVERERRFARFASHELRTPVAVMKGALELLVDGTRTDRSGPLRRMANSIGDMEALIETFLMLAREKFVKMPDERIDAAELLDSIVEPHRYLLNHKNVTVRKDVREGLTLRLPRSPLKVVLGNLIQNAFRYTDSGSVTIHLDEGSASVIDTGIGLSSESPDYPIAGGIADRSEQRVGVGLEIVGTLCSLYDWELVIEPNDPVGTRASVNFHAGRRVEARTA